MGKEKKSPNRNDGSSGNGATRLPGLGWRRGKTKKETGVTGVKTSAKNVVRFRGKKGGNLKRANFPLFLLTYGAAYPQGRAGAEGRIFDGRILPQYRKRKPAAPRNPQTG